jgi:hypothetical protein
MSVWLLLTRQRVPTGAVPVHDLFATVREQRIHVCASTSKSNGECPRIDTLPRNFLYKQVDNAAYPASGLFSQKVGQQI